MVRDEGVSSLGRGVGPNVFRAILMNASQLASYVVYPFLSRLVISLFLQLRLFQGGALEDEVL